MKLWILLFTLCAGNALNAASNSQSSPSKTPHAAHATAVLLKEFPRSEGYGPTTHINIDCDYTAPYKNDAALVFMQQIGATKTSYKRKNFFKENSNDKPQELAGALQQIVDMRNNVLLERVGDSAYLREGPGFNEAIIRVLPFGASDHAYMSNGWDWLVTLEGGHLINLYYCPYYSNEWVEYYNESEPAKHDLRGTPSKHIPNTDLYKNRDSYDIVKASLTLFTKPEVDDKPLICSFAFSKHRYNQKLALIFPEKIDLWRLMTKNTEINAEGKEITEHLLAADDSKQYCFNAGIFAHKNNTLYVIGNNFVWRYNSETEALERFRYTDIPDIDGERLIALAPSDNRLAIADPRAGVSVFDTETMSLLCTILQGSICKTIAINSCILATSVPCEDGPSQDSVWHIVPNVVANDKPTEQEASKECEIL